MADQVTSEATEYVELTDEELDAYLAIALKETFSKPGTADVSPADRAKLKGLIAHYMKMAHPFTTCVRDQRKHGLPEDHANRRCAVLKDLGTGTTKWRGKDKKTSEDGDEIEVFALDVPEDWQEEFVRELADMPATFFGQFDAALRSFQSSVGGNGDVPQLETPQQALSYMEQLVRFIRDGLRVGKFLPSASPDEAYLGEREDDHASVALAGFEEAAHPRGKGGKWVRKSIGSLKPGDSIGTPASVPGEKGVVRKTDGANVSIVNEKGDRYKLQFAKKDDQILAFDPDEQAEEKVRVSGGPTTGSQRLERDKPPGRKERQRRGLSEDADPVTVEPEEAEYDAFVSPYLSEAPAEVVLAADGKKLFWKQILPMGKRIKYRDGTYLKTDKDFLTGLAESINSRRWPAFFRMHQSGDGHEATPRTTAGVVVGARVNDKGLDVKIEPRTEEGSKFLEQFPEYPVSAFYAEDYPEPGTGKKLGPRLFHVAAVERPYINEMSPAELVAASEEAQGAHIVDLSGGQYRTPDDKGEEAEVLTETANNEETREEVQMSEQNEEQQEQVISLEEFNSLKAELEAAKALAEQESRRRTRERTLSYLRDEYADVSEAGVQAAHRLLTTEWGDGEAAIQLSDDGVVSLAEGDNAGAARGGYVKTLLDLARGSAPKLEEQGVDGATPGTGSNGEAKAKIKALSEEEGISEAEAEAKLFDQGVIR